MRLAWGHTGWALLLLLPAFVRAQAVQPSQADSLAGDSLTLAAFAERVLLYHPIVRQARLLPDQARAQIRMARGNFDPAVGWTFNEKRRKDKHYYTEADGYLKVPVWWNVDIKAGVERGFGQFIDSQNANEPSNPIAPTTGIYYAGVSIPVGRGLLFDERRNTLRQAQLFTTINQAEQVKLINKVLFDATKAYWGWFEARRRLELLQLAYDLGTFRFGAVVQSVSNGDNAGIDSVEAKVELLRREVALTEGKVDALNATVALSNFLWDEQSNPLQLSERVQPSARGSEREELSLALRDSLMTAAYTSHPEVVKLQAKVSQLGFERRLVRQQLLPDLVLDYRPYLGQVGSEPGLGTYLRENYKFGFTFYYPLLLRKERGKIESVRLKLRETDYDLVQSRRQVVNGVVQAYNTTSTLDQLTRLQEQTAAFARTLLDGENTKFRNGESSLFIVNVRERSYVEAQIKLIELQAKYAQSKLALQWASGQALDVWFDQQ